MYVFRAHSPCKVGLWRHLQREPEAFRSVRAGPHGWRATPIIKRWIRPGTKIISDGWKAYQGLANDPDYEWDWVNHSKNFLNPDNPEVHTQTIESMWRPLKVKHIMLYFTLTLHLMVHFRKRVASETETYRCTTTRTCPKGSGG